MYLVSNFAVALLLLFSYFYVWRIHLSVDLSNFRVLTWALLCFAFVIELHVILWTMFWDIKVPIKILCSSNSGRLMVSSWLLLPYGLKLAIEIATLHRSLANLTLHLSAGSDLHGFVKRHRNVIGLVTPKTRFETSRGLILRILRLLSRWVQWSSKSVEIKCFNLRWGSQSFYVSVFELVLILVKTELFASNTFFVDRSKIVLASGAESLG